MAGLRAIRGEAIIGKRLAGSRPVLGICVGMQVLFAEGAEHGERTAGCGELPGVVQRLDAPVLPHMGWNTVRPPAGTRLLAGTGPDTRFYFVHSYAARPLPPRAGAEGAGAGGGAADQGAGTQGGRTSQPLLTLATHGQDFIAAVEDGPLCATQFHPEKSADAGAAVLANWLGLIR
jgi:glutamine amidotransferase